MTRSYKSYDEYPVFKGDLGVQYTPEKSIFRIWSPTATKVELKFYEKGEGGSPSKIQQLSRQKDGLWELSLNGDHKGQFYTFQVSIGSNQLSETPGIYAKAVGVNGQRAMVVDMADTDPADWSQDRKPELKSHNDIILYELHIRDLTSHPSSGSSYPGKFLGLSESGTRSPDGQSTSLDHIVEMGVTHVHLLPSFDFLSVDESKPEKKQFNWGYDPQNYNVPEGSYATDARDPLVRIREFKQLVKSFHDKGLRVILDVVYNHTGSTENSNFNLEVPGYYYRHNEDGSWSDAAACGNETASERYMMRKFMIESLKWWVEEYHLDGFRFDLMGIHDIETMNRISFELKKIDPSLFLYGEGWTAGDSPLPEEDRALKKHANRLQDIAVFCDDLRDGIKGSVFDEADGGILAGKEKLEETLKFGIVAGNEHQNIDYQLVNYSKTAWSPKPTQTINYVSCHDNHTLYDKLNIAQKGLSETAIKRLHRLANTIVLTSQGIPFLHAGVEMLRTKGGEENSYNKPDTVNQIDWSWKSKNLEHVNYYRQLIELRKAHPAFRMPNAEMLRKHLKFLEEMPDGVVAYRISGGANGDSWQDILLIINAWNQVREIEIPAGKWQMALDTDRIDLAGFRQLQAGKNDIPGSTAWILFQ